MSVATPVPAEPVRARATHGRDLRRLPHRTYRLRVLGMGLAALPVATVLHQADAGGFAWSWMLMTCVLWPHVAFQLATRSADPFRAELRNFLIDSVFAGSLVPLMHFGVLPSVVLLAVVAADKVNVGVRGLLPRSLPGMLGAMLVVGALTGFEVRWQSSDAVMLACLPLLVIHTLAVSISSYQLVRKVQRQNLQLEELSRRDALTGLDSRGHWEEQAGALLQHHQRLGLDATLMLVDADHFKGINDRYGHAVGDDVLCAIAALVRRMMPDDGLAGRLGGDEFVIALALPLAQAEAAAEQLRIAVEHLDIAHQPSLRCSISVGLAARPEAGLGLREWIEAADRALYRAKHAGRNRIVGRDLARPSGR